MPGIKINTMPRPKIGEIWSRPKTGEHIVIIQIEAEQTKVAPIKSSGERGPTRWEPNGRFNKMYVLEGAGQ